MTRIYLAGPLFCSSELAYNNCLKDELDEYGYELVLPQENSKGINSERMLKDPGYRDAATIMIFQADTDMLESCDALLINLDGRVPDEGACVELGYACAKGKPCFAIKTDVRTAEYGTDNLMIGGAVGLKVASTIEELVGFLREAGL